MGVAYSAHMCRYVVVSHGGWIYLTAILITSGYAIILTNMGSLKLYFRATTFGVWLSYRGCNGSLNVIEARFQSFFLEEFQSVGMTVVIVVVVFTLKTVLTSIQYPSLSYSSRQINEFPSSQANPN